MADTNASTGAPHADPWIGKYVIVRCSAGGAHAGRLMSRGGRQAELAEGRRLWRWRVKGNKGVSLSDIAVHGLDTEDSKLGSPVSIILTENCEIIECSPEAAEIIAQFPTYEPR